MRIAKMIRIWRASEGIDQKDLAAEIGIGASVLSRVEKGKSPDAAGAVKIMAWMLSDAPEPVEPERETLRLNYGGEADSSVEGDADA